MGQKSYTAAYRSDAVKLAKELGASAAAQQLKIPADTLYTWISRAKKGDLPMIMSNKVTVSLATVFG